jgi:DNA-directed RNA polymerase alpha subunit
MAEKQIVSDLPKLAASARRALENANIRGLDDLANRSESDIADLHGVGPNALKQLKASLKAKGLSFR